jgi:Predicted integral membrane protein (DUF2269)
MELHEVMLVLHIAAAGTWLGANIIQAVVPGLAARQGAEVVAGWYRVAGQLSKRLYMPAGILILITGIVMVLQHDISFGSRFVTIGFGMIVVGTLLGIFIFEPGSEVAAEAVESGDRSRIKAATSRMTAFGTADTLLVLFTMTVMVLRWT